MVKQRLDVDAKEVVHTDSIIETGDCSIINSKPEVRVNSHHQNARATSYSRTLMVERVREGKSVREVEGQLGFSPRTVYKWLGPFSARRPLSSMCFPA